MAITVEGKFRKFRMKSLVKKYGMYRGSGKVTIDDSGITIEGRHVKSLGARWGIGILIVIVSGIMTGGALILGIIPVYLLVEYAILTRENLNIPWNKLTKFGVNPKKKLAGLEFEGPDWTSPAIIRTEQFRELADELRSKAPDKDVTPEVLID